MKSLKFLFILFITASVAISCSKDDDAGNPDDELIGTWKITSRTLDGEAVEMDACELKYNLKFNTKKVIEKSYKGDNCNTETTNSANYTRKGNNIEIKSAGYIWHIDILTETTLKISQVHEGETHTGTYTKQ